MKTLLLCLICFSINISFAQLTDSNLPIVVINTLGQTIVDDPKVTVDMGIINNGPGVRNYITDPFNDYWGKIAIEIRGSTSQQYPKKSYGFETRDILGNKANVSLLGMPSENDWILYGCYPDKTLMRNEIAFDLFRQMQPWSPRYVYCELVINGQYKGVYTILERIKIDNKRVDITKLDANDNAGDSLTGGYVIKVDKLTGSSSTTWTSAYQPKVKFLYHDPEDFQLTFLQRTYIQNYVTNFENAVYGPNFKDSTLGYRPYINTQTFADFLIMQELGRTVDGYRSSSFMYKDRDSKGGKLSCGPMWDFNLSFGNADYCAAYDTTGWQYNFSQVCNFTTEPPNWWPRLLQDSVFANELQCRWQYLRSDILHTDSIHAWIDSTASYLTEARIRNFNKWPIIGQYVNWNYFVGSTYQSEIDYLKWWFKARMEYMDIALPGNCWFVPTNTKAIPKNALSIKVYPNPFDKTATFELIGTYSGQKTLMIYDIYGRLVQQSIMQDGQSSITINRAYLSNGLYVYQLVGTDRLLGSGKVLVE